jgi:ubiquinone/menaquinone biosynthesis C-methylase UbiE
MKENFKSQQDLWDAQHRRRRPEHRDIANVPNEFGKKCLGYIPEGGKVLDLGAASGRDSRFFVREKNCEVYALDFSPVALEHLREDSIADGSIDFIHPLNADIREVPLSGDNFLDAIYARSSLHISDLDLEKFLEHVLSMLKVDGYLMVEGKNLLDPKIQQSRKVADNLVSDGEGHIRRIWTKEYIMEHIIKRFNLRLIELNLSSGKRVDRDSRYVNFIAQKYARE